MACGICFGGDSAKRDSMRQALRFARRELVRSVEGEQVLAPPRRLRSAIKRCLGQERE